MLEMTIINVIFLTNVEKWPIFGLSQLLPCVVPKMQALSIPFREWFPSQVCYYGAYCFVKLNRCLLYTANCTIFFKLHIEKHFLLQAFNTAGMPRCCGIS